LRGLTSKSDTILYKYSYKWTKIGTDIGICFGNNQGNFQLHRSVAAGRGRRRASAPGSTVQGGHLEGQKYGIFDSQESH